MAEIEKEKLKIERRRMIQKGRKKESYHEKQREKERNGSFLWKKDGMRKCNVGNCEQRKNEHEKVEVKKHE